MIAALTSLLVAPGLVFSAPAAPADAAADFVATATSVSVPTGLRGGAEPTLTVGVVPVGGTATVRGGTVTLTVTKLGAVKSQTTVPWTGTPVELVTNRVHKGRYVATAVFTPDPAYIFAGSSTTQEYKVKKARR